MSVRAYILMQWWLARPVCWHAWLWTAACHAAIAADVANDVRRRLTPGIELAASENYGERSSSWGATRP